MFKLRERYFIKIVPHSGDVIHRFQLSRRQVVGVLATAAIVIAGSLAIGIAQLVRTGAEMAHLRSVASRQKAQLQRVDTKAAAIREQLQGVERENERIQQLIGVPGASQMPKRPVLQKTSRMAPSRFDVLAAQAAQTERDSERIDAQALRVLNLAHLATFARARMLAGIPSIDPVDGAPVVGCFCYRSAPSSEFHPGVDLGAQYGDVVRAAAAGTIASAGWDGGYGLKIDLDHGNGYHTWYAHLSRADVQPGQYVRKGQQIGLVGDTGFATGPHLHYQVMLNGSPVDPAPYLNGVPPKVLASLP